MSDCTWQSVSNSYGNSQEYLRKPGRMVKPVPLLPSTKKTNLFFHSQGKQLQLLERQLNPVLVGKDHEGLANEWKLRGELGVGFEFPTINKCIIRK